MRRRLLVGLAGLGVGCRRADSHRLLWLAGAGVPTVIGRWGVVEESPASTDMRKGWIAVRGVSTDGNFVLCDGLYGQGALNLVTGSRGWRLEERYRWCGSIRWVPGAPWTYMHVHQGEVPYLRRCRVQGAADFEQIRLDLTPGTRWGQFGVGRGFAAFTSGDRIWHWADNESKPRIIAEGVDVAVAPDGGKLSILEKGGRLRIVKWPGGATIDVLPGRYGDAGEWRPDGSELLVSEFSVVAALTTFGGDWVRIYDLGWGGFRGLRFHRRNLGAHSMRWISFDPAVLGRVTVSMIERG